jgi:hypothetical protein
VLRDDLFQQSSKRGDVPLTIAQGIQQLALDLLTVHAERQVKRTAGGDNPQISVEH